MPLNNGACITPLPLKTGDVVGLVCPAGYMDIEKTRTCASTLAAWGLTVRFGATVGSQFHFFSGTDAERCEDFQRMLDDKTVRAILCARGGYGCSRFIDSLDWTAFTEHPKWIIGFSDVTVFHSFLFSQLSVASIHGPMAGAFNDGGYLQPSVASLISALFGEKNSYAIEASSLNRRGSCTGQLVGGNLALLAHQIGTPSDLNTDGKILFIEDVGEYLYNIDRMLLQLDRAGKLNALAGLIVGGFSDCKDTSPSYGATAEEIVKERVQKYNYPVCFNFPVSHSSENVALTVGGIYTLTVGNQVTLSHL